MKIISTYMKPDRSALLSAVLLCIAAGFLLTACVPQNEPPQQVQAANPTVTYKYRGDQELLQANQSAMTYCSQYRSIARTTNISSDSNGSKTVQFDCVPNTATSETVSTLQPLSSNPGYTYHTDQELLDASRNADIYCANNGSQRAVGTVVTNIDGSKTVTFQCTTP
jgi:hypothetical protein